MQPLVLLLLLLLMVLLLGWHGCHVDQIFILVINEEACSNRHVQGWQPYFCLALRRSTHASQCATIKDLNLFLDPSKAALLNTLL
jgi:hypothetical protein